jgi:hypothetical protein
MANECALPGYMYPVYIVLCRLCVQGLPLSPECRHTWLCITALKKGAAAGLYNLINAANCMGAAQ